MRLAVLYGLPVLTAAFGVLAVIVAVISGPVAAGITVAGAIVVAAIDLSLRHGAESARRSREAQALAQLTVATNRFRDRLAAQLPLGGTGVPEQPDRVAAFGELVRRGLFNFLRGRRWNDWEAVGILVREGCDEIHAAAALVGDRLPPAEEQRVRKIQDLGNQAAYHAFEIASAYAGYDVTEEPRGGRYGPAGDRDIEVVGMAAYSAFGSEFTDLLAEIDRVTRQ